VEAGDAGDDLLGGGRQQGGLDEAGTHGIDPDALLGVLDGRGASQTDHAMLGRDVGAGLGEPDRAEDRGHVDDGAAPVGEHGRELMEHAVEDAVQVDRQDLAPALDRILPGRQLIAPDAGVVDGDVEPAVVGDVRSIIDRTPCSSATSAGIAVARPPLSPATRSAASLEMSATATVVPRDASAWTHASPSPDPPPVTRATLPSIAVAAMRASLTGLPEPSGCHGKDSAIGEVVRSIQPRSRVADSGRGQVQPSLRTRS
jgi:hypothetical protein